MAKPNMNLSDVSIRDAVEGAIHDALRESVQNIIDEEAEAAAVKVRHRICGLADTIALRMLRHYNVEMTGEKVVIEVRKPEPYDVVSR